SEHDQRPCPRRSRQEALSRSAGAVHHRLHKKRHRASGAARSRRASSQQALHPAGTGAENPSVAGSGLAATVAENTKIRGNWPLAWKLYLLYAKLQVTTRQKPGHDKRID